MSATESPEKSAEAPKNTAPRFSLDSVLTAGILFASLYALAVTGYSFYSIGMRKFHVWKIEDIVIQILAWSLIILAPMVSLHVTMKRQKSGPDSKEQLQGTLRYHILCIVILIFGSAMHGLITPFISEAQ